MLKLISKSYLLSKFF